MKYQKKSDQQKQEDLMNRVHILEKILKKEMKIKDAALILNLSREYVSRLLAKFKKGGIPALVLKEKPGRPPFDPHKRAEIIELMKKNYFDFGPTFASEKLEELHGLKVSRETLRKWLILDGLWNAKKSKKARIHQSRLPRACFGELVQVDGSLHDWFEGRAPKCCLIVFIDDASRKIISLRFVESETIIGYMNCVKDHFENYGRPVAYYSDRHAIFITTRDEDGFYKDTQFKKALGALNIHLICARSPQAKGRVERCNQTLQGRLVKEMRLSQISSIEEANKFLPQFIKKHNAKFSVKPASPVDAHRPLTQTKEEIELILSVSTTRKVSKNLEIRWKNKILQIQNEGKGRRLQQATVEVRELLNGEIKIVYNGKCLDYKVLEIQSPNHIADSKEVNAMVDSLLLDQKVA
jgi:transposase